MRALSMPSRRAQNSLKRKVESMRRGFTRMTGLLCSGALLVSALPVSAFAASGGLAVTGQDSLVLDR